MQQMVDHAAAFTSRGKFSARGYPPTMLLGLEVATARSVGALSRLAGRGGGTTLPGKLLLTVDAGAIDRLAAQLRARLGARLRHEREDDDDGDGRGDHRRPARLQPLRSQPPLRCGLHPARLAGRRARALRGRRGSAPRGRPPCPAACRGAGKPLPRPARSLRRARARRGTLALSRRGARRRGARRECRRPAARRARPGSRADA